MRLSCAGAVVVAGLACACGRFGFEAGGASGDAGPGGGDALTFDAAPVPAPALGCREVRTASTEAMKGVAMVTVSTSRGIAALWIDPQGALRATAWRAVAGAIEVEREGALLQEGPFTTLWAAANGDAIGVITERLSGTPVYEVRAFRDDLTPLGAARAFSVGKIAGRAPIAPCRTSHGFVVVAFDGGGVVLHELARDGAPAGSHTLSAVGGHDAPSIAADRGQYALLTERADMYGPGCWLTPVSDAFEATAVPASVESTQQADCDSSTLSATVGADGVALAWMDRDPVNSVVEWRGTAGVGGGTSPTGEVDVASPIIATSASGTTVLYRSALGLRLLDGAGAKTISPSFSLAHLVTWGDQTVAVWSDASGAPFFTRLCP